MDVPLARLGEKGLLSQFLPSLRRIAPRRFIVAPGDDAAVLSSRLVLTVDSLIEDTHFKFAWEAACRRWLGVPLGRALGWKLVGRVLSDLAAMGETTDRWMMVAMGSPGNVRAQFLLELHRGIVEAAQRHGAVLAGGDTARSETFFLSGSAGGRLKQRPLTRDGAEVGDLLCIAGTVGDAAVGLQVLLGKVRLPQAGQRYFVRRFFEHEPLFEAGRILSRSSGVGAVMDVSDSLLESVEIICEKKAGADIEVGALPTSPFFWKFQMDPSFALSGGEDYALLFTLRPEALPALSRKLKFLVVGQITRGKKISYTLGGRPYQVPRYFRHFAAR